MDEKYELKQVKVRLKLSEAEPLYSNEPIISPDKATEVMAQALAQMDREYCCVVNLDGLNHPINFNIISIGDINTAYVSIPNVFKCAILSNAASIMMFHNHPSGSIKASMEDMNITKRLIEAGRIMNIPVLDHIIVAGGTAKYFSFRDNAPNLFVADENVEYSVNKSFENEAREETELAFQIADRYISIHETDGGYDYSIMGADYREIDGGVYDNPEINIRQALEDIIEDLKEKPDYNGAKGSIKAEDVLIPRDYNEVAERMASANKIDSRVCIWQHQRRTGR